MKLFSTLSAIVGALSKVIVLLISYLGLVLFFYVSLRILLVPFVASITYVAGGNILGIVRFVL